jgi:hypothetical protein
MKPEKLDGLWHYTDWNGLKGIFTKEELWLTHLAYLNDHGELAYAAKRFEKILKERGWSPESIRRTLGAIADAQHRDQCIVSFCEEGNSLTQWREYAKGGSPSFAIRFDAQALCRWAVDSEAELLQCLYGDEGHRGLLNDLKVDLLPELFDVPEDAYVCPMEIASQLRGLQYEFISKAIRIKHGAYDSECEWRVRFDAREEIRGGPAPWQFRSRGRHVIPYIALSFSHWKEPLVTDIRIAPDMPRPLTEEALRKFLIGFGPNCKWLDPSIVIHTSDIPVRSFV